MGKLAFVPLVGLVALVALLSLNLGGNEVRGASGDQQRVITVNDLFSDVARAAPAFGGMFYDEQGNLNVYLLDSAQREPAKAAIAAVFGAERVPQGGIRVLPARYSFADLRAWHDRAVSLLLIPGVASSGIDHSANRLQIGVQDLRLEGEVRRAARNLGIPEEAIAVEERAGSLVLEATLQERVRPVQAGLQIQRRIDDTWVSNCTLGVNALRGGVEGFVTASHCSSTQAEVDGSLFYQNNDSDPEANLIGYESVDPAFFDHNSDSRCPSAAPPTPTPVCRYSDSDFSAYYAGVNFKRGFIERPAGLPNANNLDIAGSFQITATGDALEGQTVNMVGRTTGWSQGTVRNGGVCVDEALDSAHILICQTEASYNSGGGDSGAPVFMVQGTTTNVTLVGIHWGVWTHDGGTPYPDKHEFSPFSQVVGVTELGPLTVTARSVGGIAEAPDADASPLGATASGVSSSTTYAAAAGIVAGAVLLAAGGWYARRRWRAG